MGTSLLAQSLISFGSGALTSLSPCVYPMLPITVAAVSQNQSGKKGVLAYLVGQILAFVAIGLFAVKLGEVFGFSGQNPWIQLGVAVFLLGFAYLSWAEKIPMRRLVRLPFAQANGGIGWALMFLTGVTSILVLSPCTTPVLSGVLVMVASESGQDWAKGILLMVLYSAGFTSIFGAIGFGVVKARSLPRAGKWLGGIRVASSLLLAAAGVYFGYLAIVGLKGAL